MREHRSKGAKMPMDQLLHGAMQLTLLAEANAPLENLSTLDPASPPAESIRFLFIFTTAVGLFILAVVWGVLFYSLLRFRRRKQQTDAAGGSTTEPPQVYGSMPIEIAWTVAPGINCFYAHAGHCAYGTGSARQSAPHAGRSGADWTVIGHQWWWEYIVKADGDKKLDIVTANEIHVPVSPAEREPDDSDKPYRGRSICTLQSADVCHSFWIPRLAGKTDLIPGRDE